MKVTNSKNLPKIQILEFHNNLYTQHTFYSCLIRGANKKWMWLVLWKIQCEHDFVHRRTDGWNQYTPFQHHWSGGIKSNRTPFLCHFKLCASFSHLWIQTRVSVQKRSIQVKIIDFSAQVTLKFHKMTSKKKKKKGGNLSKPLQALCIIS